MNTMVDLLGVQLIVLATALLMAVAFGTTFYRQEIVAWIIRRLQKCLLASLVNRL